MTVSWYMKFEWSDSGTLYDETASITLNTIINSFLYLTIETRARACNWAARRLDPWHPIEGGGGGLHKPIPIDLISDAPLPALGVRSWKG